MERFEEAVISYITGEATRFVNPQYNIVYDKENKHGVVFLILSY